MPEIKPEQPEGLKAGAEFYEAKQTPEGKPFRPDYKQKEIQEGVTQIVKPTGPEAALDVEVHHEVSVSDKTQMFIDRLAKSKSKEEATAIMNEVLSASQAGQIPPNEATELLQRAA